MYWAIFAVVAAGLAVLGAKKLSAPAASTAGKLPWGPGWHVIVPKVNQGGTWYLASDNALPGGMWTVTVGQTPGTGTLANGRTDGARPALGTPVSFDASDVQGYSA